MESEDKKPIFTKRLILTILIIILIILIILLLLRRCGNGNGSNGKVTSIVISPTSLGLNPGDTFTLSYVVLPEDAKNRDVIWTSSDESCVTVTNAGVVTATTDTKDGCTATVTATSADDSNVTASIQVTVTPSLPTLEQIQLDQDTYTVKVGKSKLVQVTAIPATAEIGQLEYEIVDTSIATVNDYGVIKGVKVGTTKLIVRSTINTAVFSEAVVKVVKSGGGSEETSTPVTPPTEVSVTSIIFTPYSGNCVWLNVDGNYQLPTTVMPANATNKKLSWSSSDTTVATVDNMTINSGTIINLYRTNKRT